MSITFYSTPNCAECTLTKAALAAYGIEFTEHSAADFAQALAAKGYDSAPVLAIAVENELVTWQGHRSDLIELLADLIATGPVSTAGLGDRDAAEEAVLTRMQVIEAITSHQLNAHEFFADCGNHPLYRGHVLLDWLGY